MWVLATAWLQAAGQQKAAKANSYIEQENARLARMQGDSVLRASEDRASSIEAQGRATQVAAVAANAANNVSTTSGSPATGIAAIGAGAAADAARARTAGAMAAWGYEAEAQQRETRAQRQLRTGALTAKTTMVQGASQAGFAAYDQYRTKEE